MAGSGRKNRRLAHGPRAMRASSCRLARHLRSALHAPTPSGAAGKLSGVVIETAARSAPRGRCHTEIRSHTGCVRTNLDMAAVRGTPGLTGSVSGIRAMARVSGRRRL
jgi:hypothetical protein